MARILQPHTIGFRPFSGGGALVYGPAEWSTKSAGLTVSPDGSLTANPGQQYALERRKQILADLPNGKYASFEFGHNAISDYPVIGWSDAVSQPSLNDVDYGFYIDGAGIWYVWIRGSYTSLPSGPHTAGVRFRIDVYADKMIWLADEVPVYTSPTGTVTEIALWPTVTLFYGQAAMTQGKIAGEYLTSR